MDGWGLLAARVAAERARRWRSRAAFARDAGISVRVVGDVERGRRANYSDATLAAIESALGWEAGSARRVVGGGKVRREFEPALVRLMELWPDLSPDARVILLELAERAHEARPGL